MLSSLYFTHCGVYLASKQMSVYQHPQSSHSSSPNFICVVTTVPPSYQSSPQFSLMRCSASVHMFPSPRRKVAQYTRTLSPAGCFDQQWIRQSALDRLIAGGANLLAPSLLVSSHRRLLCHATRPQLQPQPLFQPLLQPHLQLKPALQLQQQRRPLRQQRRHRLNTSRHRLHGDRLRFRCGRFQTALAMTSFELRSGTLEEFALQSKTGTRSGTRRRDARVSSIMASWTSGSGAGFIGIRFGLRSSPSPRSHGSKVFASASHWTVAGDGSTATATMT